MKKIALVTLFALLIASGIPVRADTSINGQWIPPGNDALVEIAATENARITLLGTLDATLLDEKNPNPGLQDRSLAGIVLGRGFVADGSEWVNGRIYDPGSGKSYRATLSLLDHDHLQVRGYVGIRAFGRTEVWLRRQAFEARMEALLARGGDHD